MFWNFVLIYGTLLAPLALYGQPLGDYGPIRIGGPLMSGLRVRRVHEPISVRRTAVGSHMDLGRMHGNPYPYPARHDTARTSATHISSPFGPTRRLTMPGVIPIGGMIRGDGTIPISMTRRDGIFPHGGVIRTGGILPRGGVIVQRPGTSSRTITTVDRHLDGAFRHGSPHPVPAVHTERRTVDVRHRSPGIPELYTPPVQPRLVPGRDRGTVVSSVHIPMVAAGTTAHVDRQGQHGHTGETPAMHVETRWAAPPGLEHLLENPVPPHVPARRTRMRMVESAHTDRPYEHDNPHARPAVHVERHLVREEEPVRPHRSHSHW